MRTRLRADRQFEPGEGVHRCPSGSNILRVVDRSGSKCLLGQDVGRTGQSLVVNQVLLTFLVILGSVLVPSTRSVSDWRWLADLDLFSDFVGQDAINRVLGCQLKVRSVIKGPEDYKAYQGSTRRVNYHHQHHRDQAEEGPNPGGELEEAEVGCEHGGARCLLVVSLLLGNVMNPELGVRASFNR